MEGSRKLFSVSDLHIAQRQAVSLIDCDISLIIIILYIMIMLVKISSAILLISFTLQAYIPSSAA
jgi:hypothetical protein